MALTSSLNDNISFSSECKTSETDTTSHKDSEILTASNYEIPCSKHTTVLRIMLV